MSFDRVRAAIRDIPDFPKPGILFKDITPVLSDPTCCFLTAERSESSSTCVLRASRGFCSEGSARKGLDEGAGSAGGVSTFWSFVSGFAGFFFAFAIFTP
jgi:hypothetical protein